MRKELNDLKETVTREFDKINKNISRLLKANDPEKDEYLLKSFEFDEKRAQGIMRQIMKKLIESSNAHELRSLMGSYEYGTFPGILRQFIEQMFSKPEDCCLYLKGTRFYAYTNGGWVEWKKANKDWLRKQFWTHCKQYVDMYATNYYHITDVPNWGFALDSDSPAGLVTKKQYIENVIGINNRMARSAPPISNTTMIGYLLTNSKLMAINRKRFKV